MDLPETSDPAFGFLLSDTARLMRARFNAIAAPMGLTLAQARVLMNLVRCEGASQKMLADLLEVQPITLLRQIDRLEVAGLVERRAHPTDRRAQCLYLTAAARPVIDALWQAGETLRDAALGDLDAGQRATLVALLATVKNRLACGNGEPVTAGATATLARAAPAAAQRTAGDPAHG